MNFTQKQSPNNTLATINYLKPLSHKRRGEAQVIEYNKKYIVGYIAIHDVMTFTTETAGEYNTYKEALIAALDIAVK